MGKRTPDSSDSVRFEAAGTNSLPEVLDAVAWLDQPATKEIAAFAGIDPRTAGKLLKNASQIGLLTSVGSGYKLSLPYPHKGAPDEKRAVIREALVRMPYLITVRQFLRLGDTMDDARRKAAAVRGLLPYEKKHLEPLIKWADEFDALDPTIDSETLAEQAMAQKERRHDESKDSRVVFISHSSLDKEFVRRLATDLTAAGVEVWLDEQEIRVGDSIPDGIARGLALSDFFLLVSSQGSAESEWVKRELNLALMTEIERRDVHILPLRIDDAALPNILADKKYADFTKSYHGGLAELLQAIGSDDGEAT